ncbi:MAG: CheR family methyltransferase [Pseudomonadota bacterium]
MPIKKKDKKSTLPVILDQPVVADPEISRNRFPIVGLGASAGGLAAFEAFFSSIPTDTQPDMAFVLVQHLAPDHNSILTELVQHYTQLKVFEVEDGVKVETNCVYIIPPNRDMALLNGTLQLLDPTAPRGHRLPIDFFFRSLAQDQQERAIGIILSGTGSDGTLGVRAIKGEGGMIMVQSIAASEFDGMPRSAIATGLVDYELTPTAMPAQLIAYVSHAFHRPSGLATNALHLSENALKKIFILLRTQTTHDFSQYKPSTICRRIERRMAVHQIVSIDAYVKYLQQAPTEVEALFRDLLIGVTSFFRDPDTFVELEQRIIPKLFEGKPTGAIIRAWSTGCSTGEEAYSIAILLQERLEALKKNYKIQVFATDIDSHAIATARAGVYPASISDDITPERLARFFTAEPDGSAYRIHKNIRDMLVFSAHDLIKDPPFSKIDLISCRNLLIYMNADLQKRVITLFHYALNPEGMLFLGTSETLGEFANLFTTLDRKAKLFQRKEDFQGAKRAALNRFLPPTMAKDRIPVLGSTNTLGEKMLNSKVSLREITEQALLKQIDVACALVNNQGDILYLHGRTGMYLEPAPGEAGINNILKMAREGLKHELTTALYKAAGNREHIKLANLRVKTNGHFTPVNVTVSPIAAAALDSPLFLVILEEAPDVIQSVSYASALLNTTGNEGKDNVAQIAELNEELQAKEEYLYAANEELETSNEELKSSNEEMQSINEELQSTNEELETSKEELQSINEELATVNTELQTKVTDLSRVNNDMNNLLAGTGIGTVFVDHSLSILRFTPAATLIINLIAGDVGRPVGHIVSNLINYQNLVVDIKEVLKTLQPKEVDVQTISHEWYTLRILPYRTLDNVIEGAVITFVDITEMMRIREALRVLNEQMLAVARAEQLTPMQAIENQEP